jgi:hypothetical protein
MGVWRKRLCPRIPMFYISVEAHSAPPPPRRAATHIRMCCTQPSLSLISEWVQVNIRIANWIFGNSNNRKLKSWIIEYSYNWIIEIIFEYLNSNFEYYTEMGKSSQVRLDLTWDFKNMTWLDLRRKIADLPIPGITLLFILSQRDAGKLEKKICSSRL